MNLNTLLLSKLFKMPQLNEIYQQLYSYFGPQGWWPVSKSGKSAPEYRKGFFGTLTKQQQFEISVGAILTQNTSWNNVLKALENLKKRNLLSKEKIKSTPTIIIANAIKPAGYFNQKAKKLKAFCESTAVPTREGLLSIWGIGPETADSILLYAYREPVFVIDAYTKRIMHRIGFKEQSYEELQDLFHSSLPKDHKLFNEFHALFVELAKKNCTKQAPKCNTCPLKDMCNYGQHVKKRTIL